MIFFIVKKNQNEKGEYAFSNEYKIPNVYIEDKEELEIKYQRKFEDIYKANTEDKYQSKYELIFYLDKNFHHIHHLFLFFLQEK